jgi:transposase-like protein
MMLEFKNLNELMQKLSVEDICLQHMKQMRWGEAPFCPHCNSTKPYKLKNGKTYRCSNKECKKNFTVTVGTIFENSKVKLSVWMAAIYLCTAPKKGVCSLQLSRDLGITQKTAWFVLHRVRLIMSDPAPAPMENIVEVDETYVGGEFANMNRGRRKKYQEQCIDNKTAVMGFVERDGKGRLTVIGESSFKDKVRENVDNKAIVMTDSHLGYVGLTDEYAAHMTVNHSQMQFRDGFAYTNSVEGFFSCLKRSIIGVYHTVSPKHLQRYFIETSYRNNTRKITDKERFNPTLQNVEGRLKYISLTAKP